MLNAFEKFGSTAIPMHMALFNIPLKIALSFEIPLVVWEKIPHLNMAVAVKKEQVSS